MTMFLHFGALCIAIVGYLFGRAHESALRVRQLQAMDARHFYDRETDGLRRRIATLEGRQ